MTMKKISKKKNLRINIIPLIDIIFLMLVFFMLATNFYEKRDIEFSIEKDISENSELKETIVIKIQKNDFFFPRFCEFRHMYVLSVPCKYIMHQ